MAKRARTDTCPLQGLRKAYQALDRRLVQHAEALEATEEALAARGQELDSRKATLEKQQMELEEREADLKCREAGLKEREEKFEVLARPLQGASDVVHLNIGGEAQRSVRRSTLCQMPETLLAAQFSGRWDEGQKDPEGRIFIDFSPDVFLPLIDFLRHKQIEAAAPQHPVGTPDVSEKKLPDFLRMANYLGLPSSLFFAPLFFRMKFSHDEAQAEVKVDKNGLSWDAEFATVVLESSFEFPSYEVVVGEVRGEPCLGWATVNFDVNEDVGCDCDFNSWGLNGITCHFFHGDSAGKVACKKWQEGDIVRCTLDRQAGLMRWFVNGAEERECRQPLPEEKLLPALSGVASGWKLKVSDRILGRSVRVQ